MFVSVDDLLQHGSIQISPSAEMLQFLARLNETVFTHGREHVEEPSCK